MPLQRRLEEETGRRRRGSERGRSEGKGIGGVKADGERVNAKYETGEVSAWNVTSLENVSRVQFSETLDSRTAVPE